MKPLMAFARRKETLFAALLALLAWWAPAAATRLSGRPALLEVGPNDVGYLEGFRPDWERDVRTRFRWTTWDASARLPVHASGSGHSLRLRSRRHFVEPARVTVVSEGRIAGSFIAEAHAGSAYTVATVALPPLSGQHPFQVLFRSASANPRPLGIAVDWLELLPGPSGLEGTTAHRLRGLVLVLVALLAARLAGATALLAAAHAALVLLAVVIGSAVDIVAAERMVREGTGAYACTSLAAGALLRWAPARRWLSVPSPAAAGLLMVIVMAALALRLAFLLHPQFYYPDVKVHSLFVWQLFRQGIVAFLRDFTENQYRFSLGLQMENGHWYAFPYPPAFYILCWPLVRLARMRPEVAVSLVAAVVNSLECLLVFGIARRLHRGVASALAAAACAVTLPIFTVRLTYAYFPALVGHALDAVVILFLLHHLDHLHRRRVILVLAALLALAFLAYTQSLLNFAILLPLFLLWQLLVDRSPEGRRRMAGLAAAGLLGVTLSMVVFYGRYVPIFVGMQRGIPMPEERILAEKAAAVDPGAAPVVHEPDDPYAGPDLDLARGLQKAAWRMWVFYALFAPVIAVGIVLLARDLTRPWSGFVAVWALTYVLLNVASGGLPGPNLVRYNKDLEIVAPLFCVALALVGERAWSLSRPLAAALAVAYLAFSGSRALKALVEKFVLER